MEGSTFSIFATMHILNKEYNSAKSEAEDT